MKRLCLIFLFVFLFSTFSIFTYAKPIVLRLGHVVSTKAPYHIGALRFAKLLKEKTKGNIIIDIYPGGQLARGEREIIEQLQFGGVDLVVTSTGPVGGFVPSMLVVDLPFLFRETFFYGIHSRSFNRFRMYCPHLLFCGWYGIELPVYSS